MQTLEVTLGDIRMFAEANGLTAGDVRAIFNAGLHATQVALDERGHKFSEAYLKIANGEPVVFVPAPRILETV